MTSIRKVRNDYYKNLVKIRDAKTSFFAFLGDKDGLVKADDYGNVYVLDFNGNKTTVYNSKVPLIPHRVVEVGTKDQKKRLEVLRFIDAYPDARITEVPNHYESHQWPKWDTLWVRGEQILPGLFVPQTGVVLRAYAFVYYLFGSSGVWHILKNQTIDLTSSVPTTGAKYILIEVDEDGVIYLESGSTVDERILLAYEDIPAPTVGRYPLVAVKVYAGQTSFINTEFDSDIIDLRFAGFGGQAASVEWGDILNKPATFTPDLTVTNPLYPRIYPVFGAPTVSDDDIAGYKQGDVWIDMNTSVIYQAADVTTGAAVWISGGGSSSGGGAGDMNFYIPGSFSSGTGKWTFLVTKDMTIDYWYISCDNSGSAGDTIYDVMLNGSTIFSVTGDRPTLAWNDANGWAKSGTPDTVDFVEGDVITIDIISVATSASGLTGVGQVTSSGGGGSPSEIPPSLNIYMNTNFR